MRTFIRFSIVASAAVVAVALSVGTASAAYPIDASSPTVDTATPDPGDCVTVSQSGLAPGTSVTIVLTDANGATTTLDAVADASGVASASLCVPSDAATGTGNVTVSDGGDVLGQIAVNVGGAQDGDGGLAFTGRTVGSTLGLAALTIVVGGVLVTLSRRREGVIS